MQKNGRSFSQYAPPFRAENDPAQGLGGPLIPLRGLKEMRM
jgi:hypothetical protein